MSINETQDDIIAEFSDLGDDWMDRYAYLIELGTQLPALAESDKTPAHLIEGCQSRVWITADTDAEGNVIYRADSDAMIVKGIIALLVRVLSGHKSSDILHSDLYFIDSIGLGTHLSPTRSNGLVAMLRQMRLYAQAFQALEQSKTK